ncbi:hypothetical protein HX109_01750 [Galbibacter sp. BG1]|uniref:hypothetical protein n=1 Tax=Galbibacter sp. BG1 TaxID=1170699 RepID=UPI0015C1C573|nr:hypothetical protein [Galbibacter sp. BG1]QLE00344.1 hypothetical protein HX109_01750 [Galbibacter sp. BG1]
MKKFLLTLVILISSCSTTIDKNGIFEKQEYSKHNLEFLNTSIFLPNEYVEIEISKLEDFLFNPDNEEVPFNMVEMWMRNIESPNSGIAIFKKISDPLNFLVI